MQTLILAATVIIGLSTLPALAAGTDFGPNNPFFAPSTLPFQAPPFDKIKDDDYQPAIEAGMAEQLKEIQAIADNPAPPTFENTIVAMEKSGQLLQRVQSAFFGCRRRQHSNPDAAESQVDRGAEARRAPGRNLSRREAVRARRSHLQPAQLAQARSGIAAPGGV